MKKQLTLQNIPKADREPFVLDGAPGVEFHPHDPWPMPPARPWVPSPQQPLLSAWQRIKEVVKV
jgi:hypothetical protein